MLQLADEVDPDKTTSLLRLAGITYGAMLVPPVLALVPGQAPVFGEYIVAAVGLAVLGAALAVHQARTLITSGGRRAPNALGLVIQALVCFAFTGSFAHGLGAVDGNYRLLILAPLLWVAVIGHRRMYVAAVAAALVTLAAVIYGSGVPIGSAAIGFLTYSAGFVAAAQFVRVLSQSANVQIRRRDRFADLAEIAASAHEVAQGLEAMMPGIARFVGVPTVALYRVDGRSIDEDSVAAYPAAPQLDRKQVADLKLAAWEGRLLDREGWTCVAVSRADAVAFVLYLEHDAIAPLHQPIHDHAVEQAAAQLSVLHTRLTLLDDLEGMTRTDALTGLPNRRALTEQLDLQLNVAARSGDPLTVVMVDLDHFKVYNDTFGHLAGDELLATMAKLLGTRMRKSDFVARFGGEEFCMVLSATAAESAAVLLHDLQRRCRELPAEQTVTFSAGIAEWDGTETISELIDRADQALYGAKHLGRDRTEVAVTDRCADAAADVPVERRVEAVITP